MAHLEVFKDGDALEKIPIGRSSKTTLGRTDCSITLDHPSLSRKHAMINFGESSFTLIDLASTHGTKLNGARLVKHQPAALLDGHIIEFGASTRSYVFRIPKVLAAELASLSEAAEAQKTAAAQSAAIAEEQPVSLAEQKRRAAMGDIEERQAKMQAEVDEMKAQEHEKKADEKKREEKAKARREQKKRKWKQLKHDKKRHKPYEKVKEMSENERVAAAAGGTGMGNYCLNI